MTRSDKPLLVVDDVFLTYPTKSPTPVLHGVTFEAGHGEVLGLLGINGAGKTTLVKIISSLLRPTSGRAMVDGYDVVGHSREVRSRVGVVLGGDRGLYNRLTALDNIRFFASLHQSHGNLRKRCREALERVNLEQYARRRVETLSKGMRQRLNIAIGLVSEPPLLLLDEPTIGLDIFEAQRVRQIVADLAARGTTIVLTSHYPVDIDQLATRVILLDQGRVTHDMGAEEFRKQIGHIAEIRVSGTGNTLPPGTTDDFTLDEHDGRWTATLRVQAWEPAVFHRVASLVDAGSVTDVHLHSIGIESVLNSLADSRGR